MANLTEVNQYDAGVYQLEISDPVAGGDTGASNKPLKNLANRTAYLKSRVDALEAIGPVFPRVLVTAASVLAVTRTHYVLTNVNATAVTLPADPAENDVVKITVANLLATNSIIRNAKTIMGLAEDLVINHQYSAVTLQYLNSSWRFV